MHASWQRQSKWTGRRAWSAKTPFNRGRYINSRAGPFRPTAQENRLPGIGRSGVQAFLPGLPTLEAATPLRPPAASLFDSPSQPQRVSDRPNHRPNYRPNNRPSPATMLIFARYLLSNPPRGLCLGSPALELPLIALQKEFSTRWLGTASCPSIPPATDPAALAETGTEAVDEPTNLPTAPHETDEPVESSLKNRVEANYLSTTPNSTDPLTDADSQGDELNVADDVEADAGALNVVAYAEAEPEELTVVDDARLKQYLCECGKCPTYKAISLCVTASPKYWRTEQQKSDLTKLVQAFCTYHEVFGFHFSMIAAASQCLDVCPHIGIAFDALVALYDDVPGL
ncbi:hypothetical protein BBJ28_00015851 [Nothophytophthora sp. Chile5]|nr:hypothetical protein BBJ28_00015851 [Nothophytophthora sp. Chile5]